MLNKLHYTVNFSNVLHNIVTDNNILDLLKKIQNIEVDADIICIDITNQDDIIKYKDKNKLYKAFKSKFKYDRFEDYVYDISNDTYYTDISNEHGSYKRRLLEESDYSVGDGKMKIGRFIGKILKINHPLIKEFRQTHSQTLNSDIETFINIYKSCINKDYYIFDIVEGKDIKKYYNRKHYVYKEGSSLSLSCMNKFSCRNYFGIYVNNPQVCKLLILRYKDNPSKICGRALLWTLVDGRKMLDIVYKNNEYDYHIFSEKAKSIGAILREDMLRRNQKIEVKIKNKHFHTKKKRNKEVTIPHSVL